ncbi:hypothetical protein PMIN07_010911 [Paraphaeosphaeria minitans]
MDRTTGTRIRTVLARLVRGSTATAPTPVIEALLAVESVVLTHTLRVALVPLALAVALRHRSAGDLGALGGTTIAGGPAGLDPHLAAHIPLLEGRISVSIARGRLLAGGTIRTHAPLAATGLRHLENGTLRQPGAVPLARPLVPAGTTNLAPVHRGTPNNICMKELQLTWSSPPRRFSPARDTRDYRRRSPSPRREHADPYTADTWRRRSPSPARNTYASNDASGRESAATSRRSSPPPVHPSRAALVPDDRPMRDAVSAPRSPFRERDFDRSRDRERERSPPRVRDGPPTGPRGDRDREFAPPSGPSSSYRNGESNYSRAPPTGPRDRSYPSPAMSPPAGPSNSTPQPPLFSRTSSHNPVLAAPTRPRGGGRGSFGYDSPRDFSGPPRRGSATWGARGGSYHGGPPSGPRGPGNGPTPYTPPFRGSSNSTSTTYPRTQRFGGHLDNLPKEIPGGQKAPELIDTSKILKLEDEARKLREQIEAKEAAKRGSLREWDALGRDADNAALRSELAEQHLRSLNGDSEVGGAAF